MVKDIVYLEESPTVEEYNTIRKNTGWSTYEDLDAVKEGLDNSLYHIIVRKEGKLIAMGRVIGDGNITFYIQDVIVKKEYQNKGIGTEIMKRIINYLNKTATGSAVVGLLASKNKESFYKKFGFIERPNESLGSGMWRREWNVDKEETE